MYELKICDTNLLNLSKQYLRYGFLLHAFKNMQPGVHTYTYYNILALRFINKDVYVL